MVSELILTDYLLLSSIIILIVICVWVTSYNRFPEKNNIKPYLTEYLRLRRIWLGSSTVFIILQHWAAAVSMLCNILVVYLGISDIPDKDWHIIIYSCVGLFCTFLVLSIAPKKMAYGYRRAFIEMNGAIEDVAAMGENDEKKAIIILGHAAKQGELLISEAQHDIIFISVESFSSKNDKPPKV